MITGQCADRTVFDLHKGEREMQNLTELWTPDENEDLDECVVDQPFQAVLKTTMQNEGVVLLASGEVQDIEPDLTHSPIVPGLFLGCIALADDDLFFYRRP